MQAGHRLTERVHERRQRGKRNSNETGGGRHAWQGEAAGGTERGGERGKAREGERQIRKESEEGRERERKREGGEDRELLSHINSGQCPESAPAIIWSCPFSHKRQQTGDCLCQLVQSLV